MWSLLLAEMLWDDFSMSDHPEHGPAAGAPGGAGRARHSGHQVRRENLTTQQMRTIGKRRADAEEKLAHHLEQARHPAGEEHPAKKNTTDH
ncbi:hypothetical protein ACVWZ8_003710 [Arthrobacter sp. UYCu723]